MNDGGPAFPRHPGIPGALTDGPGMSLRDWFAGQVLSGIANRVAGEGYPRDADHPDFRLVAEFAYRAADEMLAERAKGGR